MEARDLSNLSGSEANARPDARTQLAIDQYQHHDLSLAKAASLAGVSWPKMKEILLENGIPLRLGVETPEDAAADLRELQHHFEPESQAR